MNEGKMILAKGQIIIILLTKNRRQIIKTKKTK